MTCQRLIPISLYVSLLASCGTKLDARQLAADGGPSRCCWTQEGFVLTAAGQPCADLGVGSCTYVGQARRVFETYCVSCHSSSLSGSARNGAPSSANFDSYGAITSTSVLPERVRDRVLGETMPPGPGKVSQCDKQTIAAWVQRGTPERPADAGAGKDK